MDPSFLVVKIKLDHQIVCSSKFTHHSFWHPAVKFTLQLVFDVHAALSGGIHEKFSILFEAQLRISSEVSEMFKLLWIPRHQIVDISYMVIIYPLPFPLSEQLVVECACTRFKLWVRTIVDYSVLTRMFLWVYISMCLFALRLSACHHFSIIS